MAKEKKIRPEIKQETPIQPPVPQEKVKPVIAETVHHRAIPNIKPMQQKIGSATLVNLSTGRSLPMSRVQAEKWARKHPNKFKVI